MLVLDWSFSGSSSVKKCVSVSPSRREISVLPPAGESLREASLEKHGNYNGKRARPREDFRLAVSPCFTRTIFKYCMFPPNLGVEAEGGGDPSASTQESRFWGGSRRVYSAFKFFLYTLLGSVLMLVAIFYLYAKTGTTEIAYITNYNFPFSVQFQLPVHHQYGWPLIRIIAQ